MVRHECTRISPHLCYKWFISCVGATSRPSACSSVPSARAGDLGFSAAALSGHHSSVSAAVEKPSNAEDVELEGTLHPHSAWQTHLDGVRRRVRGESRSWQSSACTTFQSAPTRHTAGHTYKLHYTPAPLTAAVQLAAPPTASQLLTAHCRRAQRKLAAAVPGVIRTSSSCACTQDGASWSRYNTCAAGSPGMGRIPRWKLRCALSAVAHKYMYSRRQLLSPLWAQGAAVCARVICTSGPINIMTVPTSYMYWPTTLAAGRLRAAVLGHKW